MYEGLSDDIDIYPDGPFGITVGDLRRARSFRDGQKTGEKG